jgi:hypothetical protein
LNSVDCADGTLERLARLQSRESKHLSDGKCACPGEVPRRHYERRGILQGVVTAIPVDRKPNQRVALHQRQSNRLAEMSMRSGGAGGILRPRQPFTAPEVRTLPPASKRMTGSITSSRDLVWHLVCLVPMHLDTFTTVSRNIQGYSLPSPGQVESPPHLQ